MTLRASSCYLLVVLSLLNANCIYAQTGTPSASRSAAQAVMDRDLLEVTVPQLEQFYRSHKYTVTQVVRWCMARIEKYNGIYRAVQNLDAPGAIATAAREDADAKAGGASFVRGLLWGVPIVIKANTSIKGLITTDGWKGYMIPGHELFAPKDATIVAKLRAAGAVILGQTNMPDFAASDTNRSTAYGRTGNAYDVRFSPGGSSGGTVTAVTSNFALLGNGTDTGNSIRMPAATSSVVGVFPTRGLVSIAGIAPLDWLLDNTGPIARGVTDAAIALGVMAGEDLLDPRTTGSAAKAQPGPYTQYLKADALKGKRFGVPAFILQGAGIPFQGMPASESVKEVTEDTAAARLPLRPETREAFMKAIEGLRAAGSMAEGCPATLLRRRTSVLRSCSESGAMSAAMHLKWPGRISLRVAWPLSVRWTSIILRSPESCSRVTSPSRSRVSTSPVMVARVTPAFSARSAGVCGSGSPRILS